VKRSARRTVDRAEQKRISRGSRVAARERWRDGPLCDSARSSGPLFCHWQTWARVEAQVKPRSDPRAGSVLNCHSDRVYKYRQQLPITGPDNNRSYLQYNYDRLSKKNTVYAEEDMEKEGEDGDFQNRIEDLNHQKKVKYKEVGLTYSRSMAMLKLQKMC
jgi:hypothetical protein